MFKRIYELWQMRYATSKQDAFVRRHMAVYYTTLALTALVALLLSLTAVGFFSSAKRDVAKGLDIHLQNTAPALERRQEALTAQVITLSRQLGRIMDSRVERTGERLSALNNNPDALLEIQETVYEPLYGFLQMADCNGVFFILDATVNTSISGGNGSRSGIYIRFSSVKVNSSESTNVELYRGNQVIARNHRVDPHSRWKMESCNDCFPYFDQMVNPNTEHLPSTYFWTEKAPLPGSWENVSLLEVPVIGSDGTVYGICGVELNELLFQFSYPVVDTEFGPMLTVLAAVYEGEFRTDLGFVGGLTHYLSGSESLTIKDEGDFLSFTSGDSAFVGKMQPIDISSLALGQEAQWVVATLLPRDHYQSYYSSNRAMMASIVAIFFIMMLVMLRLMNRRYIRVIASVTQKREQELMADNEILDRLNRMKNNFFQNMSHDFKTPLNVIVASMFDVKDMLDYEIDKDLMRQILNDAEEEAMRMARMVDSALVYSSLADNKQIMEPMDIAPLLRKGTETFRALLERHENTLTLDIPQSLPLISGNADMLLHVLGNLLSNANRYTRNSNISVHAAEEDGVITVTVRDEGSGIDPEILPRIFERGVSDSGTGLGLSICKTAIETHGGSISAESVHGQGAQFIITLPVYVNPVLEVNKNG